MAREKVLALIMAGGAGGRMGPLAQVRAKPALAYGGVYRLVDFPLSNCVNSGISDVWVIEQYQPNSLNDHLANGRPWDLDRLYGGLKILAPQQGGSEDGWHQGNADAIYRNRQRIRDFAPDMLLVLSADHIYKLDYRDAMDRHKERDADVTLVTTEVPVEEAGRFGVVEVDSEGKVTGFEYKPDSPRTGIVTTEVFVYNPSTLLQTLDELVAESGGEEGDSLEDFGDVLLPRLVSDGRVYEYRLDGYWKDVGLPESYWRAHMDLLEPDPALSLEDPAWPILTYGTHRPPARIHETARIENSLVSPGCVVRGRVVRSILSPDVTVEQGASVIDSVLLGTTTIESGATVERAIIDKDVSVGRGARVGGGSDVSVVGRWSEIPEGTTIAEGAQLSPHATNDDMKEASG